MQAPALAAPMSFCAGSLILLKKGRGFSLSISMNWVLSTRVSSTHEGFDK